MGILDDIDHDADLEIAEDDDKGFARLRGVSVVAISERAVKVRFRGSDATRWIPKSQIEEMDESMEIKVGNTGTIIIPKWLANRMDEEKQSAGRGQARPAERQTDDVSLGNVVVLRETERALLVRIPGAKEDELWIPKNQVRAGSQCEHDGDRGTLIISHWIAGEKGLLGIDEVRGHSGENVADSRGRHGVANEPDDDIPF